MSNKLPFENRIVRTDKHGTTTYLAGLETDKDGRLMKPLYAAEKEKAWAASPFKLATILCKAFAGGGKHVMERVTIAALVLLLMTAPAHAQVTLGGSDESLLAAIAIKETAHKGFPFGDPSAVGKLGERGIYQMMPATWADFTREPIEKAATDPVLSKSVALAYLQWLKKVLVSQKITVSDERLAEAWNGGIGNVVRRTVPAAAVAYGRAVVQIEADAPMRGMLANNAALAAKADGHNTPLTNGEK